MSDGQPPRSGSIAVLERALKLALGAVTVVTVALVLLRGWVVWDALAMGLFTVAALAPLAVTDAGAPLIDLETDMLRGQGGTHRAEPRPRARMTPLGVLLLLSVPLVLLALLISR